MSNTKVTKIEISISEDLAGYEFQSKDGHVLDWERLSKQQQIKVLNTFAQGYHLFKKFLKTE